MSRLKEDTKPHERPAPIKHSLQPGEGEKVYTGSCHCGAVKLAEKTKPLPEVEVKECDCSICIRVSQSEILFSSAKSGRKR